MDNHLAAVSAAITDDTLSAMIAHPDFPKALRISAAGAVEHYASTPHMRRYTRDRGSYLVALAALYLHFSPDGLTASRLKALCSTNGICSEGRVAAILAYMRGRGHLISTTREDDRRVRLLAPGRQLLEFTRGRIRVEIAALAALSPENAYLLPAYDSSDMFIGYLRESGPLMIAGMGQASDAHTVTLNHFAERDVGLLMLYDLMKNPAALRSEPFKVSVSAVSRQLSVSRIHILKLLDDTAALGLIAWDRGARTVTLSPRLVVAIENLFALLFMLIGYYFHLLAAKAAAFQIV
jgi:hypothetical protein